MVKKWLITGGCGFIGANLVRKLVKEGGHFIRVLDNLSVGTRKDLSRVCDFEEIDSSSKSINLPSLIYEPNNSYPPIVQLIVGDILNVDIARKITENVDIIVHLAANAGVVQSVENPKQDMEVNVLGTFNMLEAARHNNVKRFIFASSGAPIGECEPPIHEEIAPHPVSPYGASKLAGEGYCSAYYRTFGIETVNLRFGNVYGPFSSHKSSVVAKFIRQALSGEFLEIYGDGNQTRDFIFIDDLVRAIHLAAYTAGIGGETFQIATNSETTVSKLANWLIDAMSKVGIDNIHIIHSSLRRGDVHRNFSNTAKAKRVLGWQPEILLQEGLVKTIHWFLKHHLGDCNYKK